MSVRDVFGTDLALLHAPSVYDFRTSVIMHGPIADAVPSTNEFEMYPVGLTSIASYLSANHYNVRIINLAYLMLRRRDFDVEAHVARLRPKMFGIDLHWLPHAQGALAMAEMVKRRHPQTPVLMGGCRRATSTKAVFKYASMRTMVPYREWPQYPTTMLLNSRGCPLECSVCGGSAAAYARVAARSAPAFRSPEKLIDDVRVIRGFSKAPDLHGARPEGRRPGTGQPVL